MNEDEMRAAWELEQWEAWEAKHQAEIEEAAYRDWRDARIADGYSPAESSRDVWTDDMVSRWESMYDPG